jgi:hypothetical protein
MRFSKEVIRKRLTGQIDYLEQTYGFIQRMGWEQVNGKGEELNRKYGEYEILCGLLDKIDNNSFYFQD